MLAVSKNTQLCSESHFADKLATIESSTDDCAISEGHGNDSDGIWREERIYMVIRA